MSVQSLIREVKKLHQEMESLESRLPDLSARERSRLLTVVALKGIKQYEVMIHPKGGIELLLSAVYPDPAKRATIEAALPHILESILRRR